MEILKTITDAARYGIYAQNLDGSTGLVPTMGALHEGHLSLVTAARDVCRRTIVSIFVNPTQFGAGEDLDAYPRTIDNDIALLRKAGVDAVFLPGPAAMYPPGFDTSIKVGGVSEPLCGSSRPAHFAGVATVVSKLLNILKPDLAFFGQKDYQQTLVIRKLVRDLNFPVTIITCPIVREADGLAMSSRNRYLSPEERKQALVLSRVLSRAEGMAANNSAVSTILEMVVTEITRCPLARIDYAEVRHPETLKPVKNLSEGAVLALAVYFGETRLIDNAVLELQQPADKL